MSKLFVFVATPAEHWLLARMLDRNEARRVARSKTLGRVGDNVVVLFRTGIGPGPARSCARRAFDTLTSKGDDTGLGRSEPSPDAVLVTGLCGGAGARLAIGDIVLYTDCYGVDGPTSKNPLTLPLTQRLGDRLRKQSIPFDLVVGLTVPKISGTSEDKRSWAELGADVVDMESHEVVLAAAARGIPVAVLRVVSDVATQDVPDLTDAVRRDGSLNYMKMLSIGAREPLNALRWSIDSLSALFTLRRAVSCVLSGTFNLDR